MSWRKIPASVKSYDFEKLYLINPSLDLFELDCRKRKANFNLIEKHLNINVHIKVEFFASVVGKGVKAMLAKLFKQMRTFYYLALLAFPANSSSFSKALIGLIRFFGVFIFGNYQITNKM